MRTVPAALAAASVLLAACGPSALERDQAAGLIADVLCTTDFLDELNPFNATPAMRKMIPSLSDYFKQKGVPKRQVAVMRKIGSAGDKETGAFVESVKLKMSGTCPDRKHGDMVPFATGVLLGMINQVPSLRDAGI